MSATAGYIKLHYGASSSVELKIKSAKGLDDPERFELWPPIVNTYIDGSTDTQIQGFRRLPIIDVGVVSSHADRVAILMWLLDNNRTLDYNTGTYAANGLSFVPADTTFESEWKFGISFCKGFTLDLKESAIRITANGWPNEAV